MALNIPHIDNLKTITVVGQFLYTNPSMLQPSWTPTSFTSNIFVDFIPDEIILKQTTFSDENQTITDPMIQIKSDLIDNQILTIIPYVTANSEYCNIRFKNFKSIQGLYTFNLFGALGGALMSTQQNIYVSFTFEFVKYKPQEKK